MLKKGIIVLAFVCMGMVFAQKVGGDTPGKPVQPYNSGITRDTDSCNLAVTQIPDANPTGVSSSIVVVADETIDDLEISVDITHTWVGDLIVSLEHNGVTAVLMDRPGVPATTFGCSGDNISVTFTDSAAITVEGECAGTNPTINGLFLPMDSLMAAFGGMSTQGTWTLTVSDNGGGDTGTLDEWCVVTQGGPFVDPNAVPTLGQWGLISFVILILVAGFVFIRRTK